MAALGQDTASLSGTVTDESKAVLPGAIVSATEVGSGRPYQTVTDERGEYRISNVAAGTYKVQAELSGFATVVYPNVQVLVGQNISVSFTLKLASVSETLTVTGEAPLVDTSSAQVAGNVDRQQMANMPLAGRNWLELSMLVKGITANDVTPNSPGVGTPDQFQLNLDGQQITSRIGTVGYGAQPKLSRDAVAEFQIVTNMFDITEGRSLGMQVNAITKSGANQFAGSTYGYFRDAKLTSKDFVSKTVLPYSDQQVGGSLGGPLKKDKVLFFGSYEYERNPFDIFINIPQMPGQKFDVLDKQITKLGLGRVDIQSGSRNHLTIRWNGHDFRDPSGGLTGTSHPSAGTNTNLRSQNILGSWTRVFNTNLVAEIRGGVNRVYFGYEIQPQFGCGRVADSSCAAGITQFIEPGRVPNFSFPGVSIGPPTNYTQYFYQRNPSARGDVTYTRGSHAFKIGGEWVWHNEVGEWHQLDRGQFTMTSVPVNINDLFPQSQWNNPQAWNYQALLPYTLSFQQNFSLDFKVPLYQTLWSAWFGDTWRTSPKLTVTYGIRWDLDYGVASPRVVTTKEIIVNNRYQNGNYGPIAPNNDYRDLGPRLGLAYDVGGNGNLVVRGGSGLFFTQPANYNTDNVSLYNSMTSGQWFNNQGRADFMTNPRGGVTREQMLACNVPANCTVPLPAQTGAAFAPNYRNGATWQSTIGFSKQLGARTVLDVDLVGYHWFNDRIVSDPNVFYDPVTGYNKSPAVFGRPNPAYANIIYYQTNGYRNYLAMPMALTRRMSNHLQFGVNYTPMFLYKDTGGPYNGGNPNNDFNPVEGEYAISREFQRHTLRSYAIYQLPWRISLSGSYFYGSGNPFAAVIGSVPFGIPASNRYNNLAPLTVPAALADRWDGPMTICTGCVIPRNALWGRPLHKIDLRINNEVAIAGKTRVSLIAEVFNVFNHANYGSYVTQVNNTSFGNPVANTGNGFAPRRGQLAIHLNF